MKYGLYYLNKKIDEIDLSSKQYAKERFFMNIRVKEINLKNKKGN